MQLKTLHWNTLILLIWITLVAVTKFILVLLLTLTNTSTMSIHICPSNLHNEGLLTTSIAQLISIYLNFKSNNPTLNKNKSSISSCYQPSSCLYYSWRYLQVINNFISQKKLKDVLKLNMSCFTSWSLFVSAKSYWHISQEVDLVW